jgi:exopolyphosphatase / guanosine-5'-triphosphate,3'-diphosphate pyrophosphatase
VASAIALARTVGAETGHQRTVARLATELFDAIAPMHVLGVEARRLLECAANVHDIGFAEGRAGHHKTSAAMILTAGVDGLDDRETSLVALIARYHRKADPDLSHALYGKLSVTDRRMVRWCSAILRVADGLDRAHDDGVQGARVSWTGKTLTIELRGTGGALDTAVAGAMRKRGLLESESGRQVTVTAKR